MPRYFFHIRTDDVFIRDPDGSDLPDLDAARSEAGHSARDLLAALLREGEVLDGQVFEISDEAGTVLARVPFRSVLRLP
ncbi:DUF6894 family protein [Rhizobium sp. LjRoot254]|uniref:DUF6894 family protein n=1 Tax=Rhizobium sp. LjRoot254 TaxID=3342297 RepID=UPI003ED0B87A